MRALLVGALLLELARAQYGKALRCYECQADDASCNEGQCEGVVCVKMETSNMDNDRKTVHKNCASRYEPTQCKQSGFGSKLITRCTCESSFCNGDEDLHAAGLQTSGASRIHNLSPLFAISLYYVLQRFLRFHA